jgi:hypothetical protein
MKETALLKISLSLFGLSLFTNLPSQRLTRRRLRNLTNPKGKKCSGTNSFVKMWVWQL